MAGGESQQFKIKFGADTVAFDQGIKGIRQGISAVKRDVANADKAFKLEPNTKNGEKYMNSLKDAIKNTTNAVDKLHAEMKQLANTDTGKNSKGFLMLKQQAEAYETELVRLNQKMKALENWNPNKVTNAMKDWGGKARETGRDMAILGSTMTSSVTRPIVGGFMQALRVGADFEASIKRVGAMTQSSAGMVSKLSDEAKRLGQTSLYSSTEVADGMQELASAGFTAQEILDGMNGVTMLGAAAQTDLSTAAEITGTMLKNFGMEAKDAGHVADVLAKTANETNAGVEDMGEAMKYVAPNAKAMGISFEETASALGIFANAGIKGSQAGTSLRTALTRLNKPTKAMKGVMDELGLEFFTTEGKMKSVGEIVGELQTGFVGLTDQQKMQAMATLFGQESLAGMNSLLNAGKGEIDAHTQALVNSNGTAMETAEQQKGIKQALENVSGAWENLQIELAERLAPAVEWVAEKLEGLLTVVQNMPDGMFNFILAVGAILAIFGPLLLIIGQVYGAFGVMAEILAPLAGTVAGVAGAFGEGAGLAGVLGALTNPLTLLVGGGGLMFLLVDAIGKLSGHEVNWDISSLGDALVTAKDHVNEAMQAFNDFGAGITGVFNAFNSDVENNKGVLDGWGVIVEGITWAISSVFTAMLLAIAVAVSAFVNKLAEVVKVLEGLGIVHKGTAEKMVKATSDMKTKLQADFDAIQTNHANNIDKMKGKMKDGADSTSNSAKKMGDGVKAGADKAGNAVIESAGKMQGGSSKGASSIETNGNRINAMMNGVASNTQSSTSSASNAMSSNLTAGANAGSSAGKTVSSSWGGSMQEVESKAQNATVRASGAFANMDTSSATRAGQSLKDNFLGALSGLAEMASNAIAGAVSAAKAHMPKGKALSTIANVAGADLGGGYVAKAGLLNKSYMSPVATSQTANQTNNFTINGADKSLDAIADAVEKRIMRRTFF